MSDGLLKKNRQLKILSELSVLVNSTLDTREIRKRAIEAATTLAEAETGSLHVKQLNNVVPGVRAHHERYDGSGYPDGLRGREIPLIARIIAVADTFDAMTTDRPYRKALSVSEAIGELKKNSGIQFDGEIVETFVGYFSGTDANAA